MKTYDIFLTKKIRDLNQPLTNVPQYQDIRIGEAYESATDDSIRLTLWAFPNNGECKLLPRKP